MSRMVIIKGKEFTVKFTLKEPNSTTPIPLISGDTGTFVLSTIGPNPEVVVPETDMYLGDETSMLNGEFWLTLTAEQTAELPFDNKFGEDGFPLSATLKGTMDINTDAEGKIYASVPQVYVEDTGE